MIQQDNSQILIWFFDATTCIRECVTYLDKHWIESQKDPGQLSPPLLNAHEGVELVRNVMTPFGRAFKSFDRSCYDDNLVKFKKLACWLCTWTYGFSHLQQWAEISTFTMGSGVFPKQAFYDKLAGDVYRFHWRQIRNGAINDSAPGALIVLANSPSMLVPLLPPDPIPTDSTTITSDPRRYWENLFCRLTAALAARYLRFQVRRYFREVARGTPLEIRYIVVKEHIEAVWNEYLASKHCLPIDASHRDTLIDEIKALREHFVIPGVVRQVGLISRTEVEANPLNSCVLGIQNGVMANVPSRAGLGRVMDWRDDDALVRWALHSELRAEREHALQVWNVCEQAGKLSSIAALDIDGLVSATIQNTPAASQLPPAASGVTSP
jgi:hypothetical protein